MYIKYTPLLLEVDHVGQKLPISHIAGNTAFAHSAQSRVSRRFILSPPLYAPKVNTRLTILFSV